ncbi:MAG: hypothetical protein NKF70_00175 [Methanobacterium sp. ERen5]|nr:MAG: hypothetical protein NKF70_00175 [Methanobacterium sp. ERen5]
MSQSKLVDYITDKYAIEQCPQCFKSITPYWTIKSIKKLTNGNSKVISERKCSHCGYVEEHIKESDIYLDGGCYGCSAGCNRNCKKR